MLSWRCWRMSGAAPGDCRLGTDSKCYHSIRAPAGRLNFDVAERRAILTSALGARAWRLQCAAHRLALVLSHDCSTCYLFTKDGSRNLAIDNIGCHGLTFGPVSCRAAEAVLARADAALPGCDATALAAARLTVGHGLALARGEMEKASTVLASILTDSEFLRGLVMLLA